jgi:hypothetical protein
MAKTKRTHTQRQADRATAARLILKGKSQSEVALQLGLSQPMVSYDLRIIREQWLDSAVRDFDEARAVELAKINALELEYWEQWELSKLPRTTEGSKLVEGGNYPGALTEASIKTQQREGNPAFLAGVQWCIDRRCRLLGLDIQPKTTLKLELVKLYEGVDLDRI